MIETFVIDKFSNNNNSEYITSISPIALLLGLVISLLAAYLAFNCNIKENAATRWVITVFSFLFPFIYVIYYFITHVLLGHPCNSKKK